MYYEVFDCLRYVCSIKVDEKSKKKTLVGIESMEELIKNNVRMQVKDEMVINQLDHDFEVKEIEIEARRHDVFK